MFLQTARFFFVQHHLFTKASSGDCVLMNTSPFPVLACREPHPAHSPCMPAECRQAEVLAAGVLRRAVPSSTNIANPDQINRYTFSTSQMRLTRKFKHSKRHWSMNENRHARYDHPLSQMSFASRCKTGVGHIIPSKSLSTCRLETCMLHLQNMQCSVATFAWSWVQRASR